VNQRLVIAIDGPSGSGKSTTSKAVARELGLAYLDTGAMYRAVACAFVDAGVAGSDVAGVIAATLPDVESVVVNGRDVTERIRSQEISTVVSAVSTVPECRANLVERQRAIIAAAPSGIVAEGRDITTVVAPEADVRLLLTADPEVRMARRNRDLGGEVDASALADQVLRRDADDSLLVNFTTAADGVVHLDCTHLSLQQTIDAVLELVRNR
jgi:cytidylate kinase